MKLLVDFFPIVLFFAAYKLGDIYIATLAAMVGSVLQVAYIWLRTRKVETMHLVSLLGLTIAFVLLQSVFLARHLSPSASPINED
ncbi:MAG: hypothetical protein EB012_00780 [Gammaproteobacteria bacterium]|nr:hypothetical protein [Gammaproteobacteria bacterium]